MFEIIDSRGRTILSFDANHIESWKLLIMDPPNEDEVALGNLVLGQTTTRTFLIRDEGGESVRKKYTIQRTA